MGNRMKENDYKELVTASGTLARARVKNILYILLILISTKCYCQVKDSVVIVTTNDEVTIAVNMEKINGQNNLLIEISNASDWDILIDTTNIVYLLSDFYFGNRNLPYVQCYYNYGNNYNQLDSISTLKLNYFSTFKISKVLNKVDNSEKISEKVIESCFKFQIEFVYSLVERNYDSKVQIPIINTKTTRKDFNKSSRKVLFRN